MTDVFDTAMYNAFIVMGEASDAYAVYMPASGGNGRPCYVNLTSNVDVDAPEGLPYLTRGNPKAVLLEVPRSMLNGITPDVGDTFTIGDGPEAVIWRVEGVPAGAGGRGPVIQCTVVEQPAG